MFGFQVRFQFSIINKYGQSERVLFHLVLGGILYFLEKERIQFWKELLSSHWPVTVIQNFERSLHPTWERIQMNAQYSHYDIVNIGNDFESPKKSSLVSSLFRAIFHSRGDRTPPCRVLMFTDFCAVVEPIFWYNGPVIKQFRDKFVSWLNRAFKMQSGLTL